MSGRRLNSAVIVALLLSVALLGNPEHGRAAPEAVVGTAFTYQGRLVVSGNPANAQCDFEFAVWNAESGGSQVGSTFGATDVPVSDGIFTVRLDFGSGVFTGDGRWLAIAVRCPAGSGAFTALAPRQPITPAPYALYSLNTAEHSHWGDRWSGFGPGDGLRLDNTATSGYAYGISGESASTDGRGVYGYVSAATGATYGVQGQAASTGGSGVYGLATASSGQAVGVRGESESTNGRGVFGHATATSGQTYGVVGQTASPTGIGVQGSANSPTGLNIGVWGISSSSDGTGVSASATAPSGTTFGVYAQSASNQGYGVYGVTFSQTGVTYGVYGRSLSDSGYAGYFSGKGADAMVVKNLGSGRGIYVDTSDDTAIWALTDAGIAAVDGRNASSSGRGLYGYATATTGTNYGVYGRTSSSSGYAGYFQGNLHTTGTLSKAAGSFKIDHPLDPANRYLYHSFVESPDMKNIYDGVVVLDADGMATVTLPAWFEALNRDFRYQLTPVGAAMSHLHVAQKIVANAFRIAGGVPGQEVSWQVTGIRHDAYADAHRIPVEEPKPLAERGLYLHPTELGQDATMSLDHQRNIDMTPAELEQAIPPDGSQ